MSFIIVSSFQGVDQTPFTAFMTNKLSPSIYNLLICSFTASWIPLWRAKASSMYTCELPRLDVEALKCWPLWSLMMKLADAEDFLKEPSKLSMKWSGGGGCQRTEMVVLGCGGVGGWGGKWSRLENKVHIVPSNPFWISWMGYKVNSDRVERSILEDTIVFFFPDCPNSNITFDRVSWNVHCEFNSFIRGCICNEL